MHDIDCSDVRDAGTVEQAENTHQRDKRENEGHPSGDTFVAHESAFFVEGVGVLQCIRLRPSRPVRQPLEFLERGSNPRTRERDRV
jgi:hypothetical protein